MSGPTYRIVRHDDGGWWVLWGRETFYDENCRLRRWETCDQAQEWVEACYPYLKLDPLDPADQSEVKKKIQSDQIKLF